MRSNFSEPIMQFSEAVTSAANAIRETPSNRQFYSPMILAIAESLLEYREQREVEARSTPVAFEASDWLHTHPT